MADNTAVARVSAIQGQALAKDKNGALRALRVGDAIFEGDVILAAENSRVDLATLDGRSPHFARQRNADGRCRSGRFSQAGRH